MTLEVHTKFYLRFLLEFVEVMNEEKTHVIVPTILPRVVGSTPLLIDFGPPSPFDHGHQN